MIDPIDVDSFDDLTAALQRYASATPERIDRLLGNAAVQVADDARPLIPRGPTGAARASLGVRTGPGPASVGGGGSRAPYYPWLEFGGAVGRNESVRRPLVPGGRYIWPAWAKNRTDVLTAMERGLAQLATESGF
jgi:hypothetical protein